MTSLDLSEESIVNIRLSIGNNNINNNKSTFYLTKTIELEGLSN